MSFHLKAILTIEDDADKAFKNATTISVMILSQSYTNAQGYQLTPFSGDPVREVITVLDQQDHHRWAYFS